MKTTIDAMKQAKAALQDLIGEHYGDRQSVVSNFGRRAVSDLSAAIARKEAQSSEAVPCDVCASRSVEAMSEIEEAQTVGPENWDYFNEQTRKQMYLAGGKEIDRCHARIKELEEQAHPAPPPSGERAALLQDINKWIGWTNTVGYPDLGRVLGKSADMLATGAQASELQRHNDYVAGFDGGTKRAQQVAVPQAYGELIRIAAWLLSPEPTRSIDALEENTHIGHRQFSAAQEAMRDVLRLKAIAIKEAADKLAAAPPPPQAERVPLTPEQIQAGHDAADIAPTDTTIGTFIEGVRFAESNHGVKP